MSTITRLETQIN